MAVVFGALLFLAATSYASFDEVERIGEEGYYKREHSLAQPYHGSGMDVPFWSFGGSTVISSNYVRLTPDRQSKKGFLWNTYPAQMHNWELLLHFEVHGQGKTLFGDGFAVWYTKEHGDVGPVFGNRDYFTGLGVFFDTYSNHNGEHSHDHPYISAMVNNGSLHYDHDRDGTHSQVSGCTCYFRNANQDTYVMISYINRQILVMTNIDEMGWKTCFSANDVDLPTGYYFGVSAATGDLADNHDVISFKVYDVDPPEEVPVMKDGQPVTQLHPDWSTLLPKAGLAEAPRAHVDDIQPVFSPSTYRAFSYALLVLLVVGLVVVVGGIAFVKNQERSRKRFF